MVRCGFVWEDREGRLRLCRNYALEGRKRCGDHKFEEAAPTWTRATLSPEFRDKVVDYRTDNLVPGVKGGGA